MKAGLAANLFAFDAITAAGFSPAAPIHLQSVVLEESTGNGALSALLRGYTSDEGGEAEAVLGSAHRDVFGQHLQSFTTPGYLDGRVYTNYGSMPTLTYGPRSLDIHAFDERFHIESVRNITKTIALFTAEWCGMEPLK